VTHRFNMALLLLLIAIGLPFYWLLMDNRPGDPEPRTVTMAQLRRIAALGPGPEPVAIQFEQIAATPHMRNRLTAGRGIRYDWQPFHAFRVDYGDLPPVLIETGMTRRQAQDMQFARYDDEAARRIASEIERARAVILLGRGVYHGGLLVPDIPAGQAVPDPNKGKTLPFSPANGIAVLAADELRDRARIAFVRLADGREYLFAGAAARTSESWHEMRAPSRLDTDLLGTQDREETYRWLRTIRKLKDDAPELVIVPRRMLPKDHGMTREFPETATR
jgi:hypothetical protein